MPSGSCAGSASSSRSRTDGRATTTGSRPGRVLLQQPEAGSLAKPAQVVRVVLSLGPRALRVPDLTGLAPRAAALKLARESLELGPVSWLREPAAPAGILAQDPEPETPASKGEAVRVLTNRGAPESRIVMPDLVGKDAEAARARLEKFGFKVGSARFETYEGVRPEHDPQAVPAGGLPALEPRGGFPDRLPSPRHAGGSPLMRVSIAPSLLSADFARLADALAIAEEGGADLVHVDVMDGHFVPNLTIGPPVVRALRKATRLPLDVHLMIERPEATLGAYLDAGANWMSVHVEATDHLQRCLDLVRRSGAKAGAAINPGTPTSRPVGGLDRPRLRRRHVGQSRLGRPGLPCAVGRQGPRSARGGPGRRLSAFDRGRRGSRAWQRRGARFRRRGNTGRRDRDLRSR